MKNLKTQQQEEETVRYYEQLHNKNYEFDINKLAVNLLTTTVNPFSQQIQINDQNVGLIHEQYYLNPDKQQYYYFLQQFKIGILYEDQLYLCLFEVFYLKLININVQIIDNQIINEILQHFSLKSQIDLLQSHNDYEKHFKQAITVLYIKKGHPSFTFRSGLQFGCDCLIYDGDYNCVHSSYMLISDHCQNLEFITQLAHNLNKKILISYVNFNNNEITVNTREIQQLF